MVKVLLLRVRERERELMGALLYSEHFIFKVAISPFHNFQLKGNKKCSVRLWWCYFIWGRTSHHALSLPSFSVLSVILSVLFCMLVHANLCLLLPIGAAALTPLQIAGSNHLYAYLQKNPGNTGKKRKTCSKWILMLVKDMLNMTLNPECDWPSVSGMLPCRDSTSQTKRHQN